MSLWTDIRDEVRDAAPELREVVKKELANQVTKRIATQSEPAPQPRPVSSNAGMNSALVIVAVGLVAFLILRK